MRQLGIYFTKSDISGSTQQNIQEEKRRHLTVVTTCTLVQVDYLYLFLVIKLQWIAHSKYPVLAGGALFVL
jgi:hypothetical protein